MFKKNFKIGVLLAASFAFAAAVLYSYSVCHLSYAQPDESDYDKFVPAVQSVPSSYIWRIRFSESLDINSAGSGISLYEYDSLGTPSDFPVTPMLDSFDSGTVQLHHHSGFDSNCHYKLFIDSSVKSSSGKSLSRPVMMEFDALPENEGFAPYASNILKVKSTDESSPSKAANYAYTFVEISFNRQLHPDTTSSTSLLKSFGGATTEGLGHYLYVNGKLTDATVDSFKWENPLGISPKLYLQLRRADLVPEGCTLQFAFNPGVVKDISGEPLSSEALSMTIQNAKTPVGAALILPDEIFEGSIKNDPTNGGNGHIQIYFPKGTDLRPFIAMDKRLVMTKPDGTSYEAKLHIDDNGILTYGIYNILNVNIDVPFNTGDTFTFSGFHGADLSGLTLTVNQLH